MKEAEAQKLSILHKALILKEIIQGNSINHYFHDLSASQIKDLRNFLEKEIQYVSHLQDDQPLDLDQIKSRYPNASEYYRTQDCHEPIESCLDESCYKSNPVCFGLKMSSHIEILVEMLRPYLRKDETS
jgi:hypothetical protein